jgi:glycosyltransferase involved in cell wall biosynthesis
MSRKRVLLILPSYDAGGAENYALRLIAYAGQSAYVWHVTSGNLNNSRLAPAFAELGATVHYESPGFFHPGRARRFSRFLRSHEFDAVMTLNGVFAGVSLMLAKFVGVPIRIAWHRRSTPAYMPTFGRRLYAAMAVWLVSTASTAILSNGRAALDHFHGAHWERDARFRVIPNGVDPERFRLRHYEREVVRKKLGIPLHAMVIGHVGRVDPAKDHDTVFATVKAVCQSTRNVRLLLVGTGTDSAAFGERIRAHGIEAITYPIGVREDVERLYTAMDVFLFPSVTEGQPNALIEAVLSGVKVVATDIPPNRAALPDVLHERLFPPRDAERASAIIRSIVDQSPEIEQQARDWAVQRYDPTRNFNAVLEYLSG